MDETKQRAEKTESPKTEPLPESLLPIMRAACLSRPKSAAAPVAAQATPAPKA